MNRRIADFMPKYKSSAPPRLAAIFILTALIASALFGAPAIMASPATDVTIGGLVWGDYNGDGLFDDGSERGLVGIGLRMYADDGDHIFEPNADDKQLVSAVTGKDGRYGASVPAAQAVWVEVNEGTLRPGLGVVSGPGSSPNPALVTNTDQDVSNIDFGFSPRGSIWGTVFYDRDLDGQHGTGEQGVPNVEICLYRDLVQIGQLGAGDQFLICNYTDSQGNTAFGSLLYGDYLVAETARPGVGNSTPNVRAVFLDPWLATGTQADAIGDVLLASVSGTVYIDMDGDGRHDPNESLGVSDVPLQATHITSGKTVTAQSDSQGRYTISDLMPGGYRLQAPELINSLVRTSPAEVNVSLGFGEQGDSMDFGYIAPTSVTLVSFVAEQVGNGVRLRWTTGSEQNQNGFVILRGLGPDKPFSAVSSLIPASNNPEGAVYEWVDASAAAGIVYWYKLQSLPDGELFGPVTVGGSTRFQLFMPSLFR